MDQRNLRAMFTGMVLAIVAAAPAMAETDPATRDALGRVLAAEHRSPQNRERDTWRHPRETLEFFGFRKDQTVVELWPGGGWYMDILAPVLKDGGRYIAAGPDKDVQGGAERVARLRDKAVGRPDLYGTVTITELGPNDLAIAPPESVDLVLTFRNIHNWMAGDWAPAAFKAMFDALKPGGTLGVVEHRASDDQPQDPKARNGYVRQDHVLKLAKDVGFVLVAAYEINANPRDTKDHPEGVWTLPPVLALKDKDREKYVAIGESDRMTLRFMKPRG